jgi:DNA-binding GntR family transcriptional regulator
MSSATNVVHVFPTAGRTLHGTLLDGLRAMINHGELAPGSRVPERALCQKFAVSRTPLREALKVLAAEGLVQLLPNRGARVARLDDAELGHLFEVIGLLEAEGGRLAAARIGAPALAEIQSMHYRMYAHFLRRELPEYFALNQAIHEAILSAAGNPVLMAMYMGLSGRITRARYMANKMRADRWQQAMDEHDGILAALCERDGERLARLLARHLANKRDIVQEAIRMAGDADHPRLPEGAEAANPP